MDVQQSDDFDEDTAAFVVDPDDYAQTRKLKAINDARDRVRAIREDYPLNTSKREWGSIHYRLNEAVVDYGNELLPLIEEAHEKDLLEGELLEVDGVCSVLEYLQSDGMILEQEDYQMGSPYILRFYRQFSRIERKLGLGLELEEETAPAEV